MKDSVRTRKAAEIEEEAGNASKPVSLAPLSFDEALDGLLAVKPEPKGEPKKAAKKRAAKKAARR